MPICTPKKNHVIQTNLLFFAVTDHRCFHALVDAFNPVTQHTLSSACPHLGTFYHDTAVDGGGLLECHHRLGPLPIFKRSYKFGFSSRHRLTSRRVTDILNCHIAVHSQRVARKTGSKFAGHVDRCDQKRVGGELSSFYLE